MNFEEIISKKDKIEARAFAEGYKLGKLELKAHLDKQIQSDLLFDARLENALRDLVMRELRIANCEDADLVETVEKIKKLIHGILEGEK